jgi:Domain of unknown function (DUF5753)
MEARVLSARVEARLLRQKGLDAPSPPRYRTLADEAVFHRQVGGFAVMKAQLGKILRWTTLDRVQFRRIRFSAGAHASADSNSDWGSGRTLGRHRSSTSRAW